MKIGLRIKNLREERASAKASSPAGVGVTQPTVSDWGNNKTEPTVDNLRLLAVEFDVFFEWLATGRGDSNGFRREPTSRRPSIASRGRCPTTRRACSTPSAGNPRHAGKRCWHSCRAGVSDPDYRAAKQLKAG